MFSRLQFSVEGGRIRAFRVQVLGGFGFMEGLALCIEGLMVWEVGFGG